MLVAPRQESVLGMEGVALELKRSRFSPPTRFVWPCVCCQTT